MTVSGAGSNAPSTGQTGTDTAWLDVHFESSRAEYEEAVASAGFQAGWHVLDAGCGAGSFIPLLCRVIGSGGRVTAIDYLAGSIELVQERLARWESPCPVETSVASVGDLPFDADTFDAVWLGNVLMYFTDTELPSVLEGLRRVVRPGGLIAAKESDSRLLVVGPVSNDLLRQIFPFQPVPPKIPGIFRALDNIHWFRRAGLTDVRQWLIPSERYAPLDDVNRSYIGSLLRSLSSARLQMDAHLPDDLRTFFEDQLDPESDRALVNHPEFTSSGSHVMTVGRVLGETA